jgi:hypothetical protein
MSCLFELVKSSTKAGKPTLTLRTQKLILTIGKNKYGGCYLNQFNTETRESNFVDLSGYYNEPLKKDRTYSHSLTSAICAVDILASPNPESVGEVYKILNNKYNYITELNEYLNAK